MVLNATFNNISGYIVAVSFMGGGNWNYKKKKSLLITIQKQIDFFILIILTIWPICCNLSSQKSCYCFYFKWIHWRERSVVVLATNSILNQLTEPSDCNYILVCSQMHLVASITNLCMLHRVK
jgi:hypothetical protein